MRRIIGTVLLVGGLAGCLGQRTLLAQACQDDEEMSKTTLKDVTDLEGARSNQLYGFGLVVGLDGTGSKSLFNAFLQVKLTY